jgi:cytochrome c5
MMKKIGIAAGALVAFLALAAGGLVVWAKSATAARLGQSFEAHTVDIAVPMPLTDADLEELRATLRAEQGEPEAAEGEGTDTEEADVLEGVDLDALALERARERGKHLVEARFVCVECHGRDFTGATMIDDPAMGTWSGPNLTGGEGSPVAGYTMADWDRIVRHGIKPDGTPAIMPSEDFVGMSDRELSDIVAYIQSFEPVDKEVPAPTFGPVGTMLVATGSLPLSAEHLPDHHAVHPENPPEAAVSVEFGAHLAQVCTGCHRRGLDGGPMPFGPPDWAPAANLTPHAQGLQGWTFEQFAQTMTTGTRPDGSELQVPMNQIVPYAQEMTEVEMEALWTYLQSVEAKPTGE